MSVIFESLLFAVLSFITWPEVKVAGALKNIMTKGDLSAHVNIDSLDKKHLFGLGPVEGLKGEIMILDGTVYTSSKNGANLLHQQDKIAAASMLVYSNVEKWKAFSVTTAIKNYEDLEKLVATTALENGYTTGAPFCFKIETKPSSADFHIIDWEKGTTHTKENHKQFSYAGELRNKDVVLLGFYSRQHQGIFTHHTAFMHVHVLDVATKTVGHLDSITIDGPIIIYLPVK